MAEAWQNKPPLVGATMTFEGSRTHIDRPEGQLRLRSAPSATVIGSAQEEHLVREAVWRIQWTGGGADLFLFFYSPPAR